MTTEERKALFVELNKLGHRKAVILNMLKNTVENKNIVNLYPFVLEKINKTYVNKLCEIERQLCYIKEASEHQTGRFIVLRVVAFPQCFDTVINLNVPKLLTDYSWFYDKIKVLNEQEIKKEKEIIQNKITTQRLEATKRVDKMQEVFNEYFCKKD